MPQEDSSMSKQDKLFHGLWYDFIYNGVPAIQDFLMENPSYIRWVEYEAEVLEQRFEERGGCGCGDAGIEEMMSAQGWAASQREELGRIRDLLKKVS